MTLKYASLCLPSYERGFAWLTRLLVGLLVWPDDRAEVGEDQCAQSAGAFLWSAVVVEGVLAQHKPVSTLLDPAASHLP